MKTKMFTNFQICISVHLNKCVQWAGGERISHLPGRKRQNVPKQTYLCISAPTNLQYESRGLMTGNNNVYKTIWKERK